MTAKRKLSRKTEGSAIITDGRNPELVVGARFDGILEIPVIEKPEKLMVPTPDPRVQNIPRNKWI